MVLEELCEDFELCQHIFLHDVHVGLGFFQRAYLLQ